MNPRIRYQTPIETPLGSVMLVPVSNRHLRVERLNDGASNTFTGIELIKNGPAWVIMVGGQIHSRYGRRNHESAFDRAVSVISKMSLLDWLVTADRYKPS